MSNPTVKSHRILSEKLSNFTGSDRNSSEVVEILGIGFLVGCRKGPVSCWNPETPAFSDVRQLPMNFDQIRWGEIDLGNYLQAKKIKVMAHSPYSPDLAPSDFWLFNTLKRNLGSYWGGISLGRAIATKLKSIPRQEYSKNGFKE